MIPNWINLSTTAGTGTTTVSVTASSYSELVERTGSLTVRSGDRSAVVTLAQRPNYTLELSPYQYTFPNSGGTFVLNITTQDSWSLSWPSWLSVSQSSGTGDAQVTVSASPRTATTTIQTNIVVSNSSTDARCSVRQEGNYVGSTGSINPSVINVGSAQSQTTVYVSCTGNWKLLSPDFILLSRNYGSSGTNIPVTVTVSQNNSSQQRTGSITLVSTESGDYDSIIDSTEVTQMSNSTVIADIFGDRIPMIQIPCGGGNFIIPINTSETLRLVDYPSFYNYNTPYDGYHTNRLSVEYDDVNKRLSVNCLPYDTHSDATVYADGGYINLESVPNWGEETHSYRIAVCQPSCYCTKTFEVTNTYNITGTTDPTFILRIFPAYITDIKIDGVTKDISNDFEGDVYYGEEELYYTFNTTGVHTISISSYGLPTYVATYRHGPAVGPDAEIPLHAPLVTTSIVGPREYSVSMAFASGQIYQDFDTLTSVNISWNYNSDCDCPDCDYPYEGNISDYAFQNCVNLSAITLNGCSFAGYKSFENCSQLHSITFGTPGKPMPTSAGVIRPDAFSGSGINNINWHFYHPHNFKQLEGIPEHGEIHAPSNAPRDAWNTIYCPVGWSFVFDLQSVPQPPIG